MVYRFFLISLLLLFSSHPVHANPQWTPSVFPLIAEKASIEEDLHRILEKSEFGKGEIQFLRKEPLGRPSPKNQVRIHCPDEHRVLLEIEANDEEWSSTFYFGLQKLGFLFPHPRIQINPTPSQIRKTCGQEFLWEPRLKFRGFHFHTQHPNEWTYGFLMNQPSIGEDTLRWLARNQQNVFNLVLLKDSLREGEQNLINLLNYAKRLGISSGISVSFNSIQQKSYRLLDLGILREFFVGLQDLNLRVRESVHKLSQRIPFDFLVLELGTSEFTPTHYEKTLEWINSAKEEIEDLGKQVFIKIHVSTGQSKPEYGNYNFLPQFSSPSVGIWPHTVMFYSLDDDPAPVYGRENFFDMKELILKEKQKRRVWYFPETSYYIGMDIDVPLFLTDYLTARSRDMDFLEDSEVEGQITFTTGHELGYWLFDWTVALLANKQNRGNPQIGLQLLGEDRSLWEQILAFETQFFKSKQMISVLSASTLLDEIPVFAHPIHDRIILRHLKSRPEWIREQVNIAEAALANFPDLEGVRNSELKIMLEVTRERIKHVLQTRRALLASPLSKERIGALEEAQNIREYARSRIWEIESHFQRYPEAFIFQEKPNLTSYPFGYGWTAASLHFWEREERMIRQNNYSPFFMNIYQLLKILF